MIQLTDEQWERIRHHFPEEHIPDGRAASPENTRTGHREDGGAPSASSGNYEPEGSIAPLVTINAALGRCFLRLAKLDSGEFERLSPLRNHRVAPSQQFLITLDMLRRR